MRPIGPTDIFLIDQADVCFVDECSGLEGVTFSLAAHVASREPVQLFVDQRIQLVECGLIPFAPLSEQLSDLMWWFLCQLGVEPSCFKLGDFTRLSQHLINFSDVQFFFCNHAACVVFQKH